MIKAVGLVVLGAIGALEAEKWLARAKMRMTPRAITDSMFDRLNAKLEDDRKGVS